MRLGPCWPLTTALPTATAVAVAACAALLTGAVPAGAAELPASRPASGGTWGTALEVPGIAALNIGRAAQSGIDSVSCASAGNCSAGGHYTDRSDAIQAFVVSEQHGTWGGALEVPGTAALNTGRDAEIISVSCASAGNCSAGGYYDSRRADQTLAAQAFVVSEKNGIWGTAHEVRGIAALNKGGDAQIGSVSCASPGNCSVGGYYTGGALRHQAFVVSQRNGTWETAQAVPGAVALNKATRGNARVSSVSCTSAGNCSAGGSYTGGSQRRQAFVVSQRSGTWGTAQRVRGTAVLNAGGDAAISSVSCTSAGRCGGGGYYTDSAGISQPFVVSQRTGTWGEAAEVSGLASLNTGPSGQGGISSVSCTSAGNCSAGGSYTSSARDSQPFVVSETDGTWGAAREVLGGLFGKRRQAAVTTVSCASAGNCSAGGYYFSLSFRISQAFVVDQRNGIWGKAEEVPGIAALNTGGSAALNSVSCVTADSCGAGGFYSGASRRVEAFVVSKT